MKALKILLDTDLGGDCDDVGAVAMLNVFHNLREAEIVGIAHNTSLQYGVAAIDAINRFYGNHFDLGGYKGKAFMDEPGDAPYLPQLYKRFGSKYVDDTCYEEAVHYYRKKLSTLTDNCKLVGIGQMNNFAALLESGPDALSPLTGAELIARKVDEVILMAGLFSNEAIEFEGCPYEKEYNIVCDIGSARNFVEKCSAPITFIDFFLGYKIKTFGPFVKAFDEQNPVSLAYKLFSNGARESWDPVTVLYAVRGLGDLFKRSEYGKVVVKESGETAFIPGGNGKHSFLRAKVPDDIIAGYIDELMMKETLEMCYGKKEEAI